MTRTHAAYQLLRHGPLTLEQFRWITCWPSFSECKEVLDDLRGEGKVVLRNVAGRKLYDLPKRGRVQ